MMVALIVLMVWIGIYPKPFFDFMEEPVDYIVQKVDPEYFARNPHEAPAILPSAPAAEHHEVASK